MPQALRQIPDRRVEFQDGCDKFGDIRVIGIIIPEGHYPALFYKKYRENTCKFFACPQFTAASPQSAVD